jgi:hypothetical protein
MGDRRHGVRAHARARIYTHTLRLKKLRRDHHYHIINYIKTCFLCIETKLLLSITKSLDYAVCLAYSVLEGERTDLVVYMYKWYTCV